MTSLSRSRYYRGRWLSSVPESWKRNISFTDQICKNSTKENAEWRVTASTDEKYWLWETLTGQWPTHGSRILQHCLICTKRYTSWPQPTLLDSTHLTICCKWYLQDDYTISHYIIEYSRRYPTLHSLEELCDCILDPSTETALLSHLCLYASFFWLWPKVSIKKRKPTYDML